METAPQGNLFRPLPTTKEQKIIHLVCKRFDKTEADLIRHCNKPEYSDPRRLCWWLLNRHAGMSHKAIAHHFDCRERTTVLHGIAYIRDIPKHSDLKEHRDAMDRLCQFLK